MTLFTRSASAESDAKTSIREQLILLGIVRPTRFQVVQRGNYAVLDTATGVLVERNQYHADAEYIARRLNAGLPYTPGGHTGPPKRYTAPQPQVGRDEE